jgi:hypothetical protein
MDAKIACKANLYARHSTTPCVERTANLRQIPVDFASRPSASSCRSIYGAGGASPWRMTMKRHAGGVQPADAPWSDDE